MLFLWSLFLVKWFGYYVTVYSPTILCSGITILRSCCKVKRGEKIRPIARERENDREVCQSKPIKESNIFASGRRAGCYVLFSEKETVSMIHMNEILSVSFFLNFGLWFHLHLYWSLISSCQWEMLDWRFDFLWLCLQFDSRAILKTSFLNGGIIMKG